MKTHEIIKLLDDLAADPEIARNKALFLRIAKARAALVIKLRHELAAKRRRSVFRYYADEMRGLLT